MTCIEQFTREIRQRGYRMTPQRLAVLQILHQGGHFSPGEVYEQARHAVPGVTEATVYRTLEFLEERQMVVSARARDGRLLYELAGHTHHHLLCRACGRMVQIDHALIDEVLRQLEATSGFRLDATHLTFSGLCPECQRKEDKP